MNVIKIQIVLFLKNLINRPDLLAEHINDKMGGLFDAMPMCLDLPMDAPAEIPVVSRKSTRLPHVLNISRNRCDLVLTPNIENSSLSVIEARYSDEIDSFIKATLANNSLVRIGVVYTVFEEIAKPCDVISQKYFGGSIKGESELSFRVNKVTNIKGIEVNNVFNVSNATAETNGETREGIVYIRDVNNVVGAANTQLTPKQINSILKHSYATLDDKVFGEAK